MWILWDALVWLFQWLTRSGDAGYKAGPSHFGYGVDRPYLERDVARLEPNGRHTVGERQADHIDWVTVGTPASPYSLARRPQSMTREGRQVIDRQKGQVRGNLGASAEQNNFTIREVQGGPRPGNGNPNPKLPPAGKNGNNFTGNIGQGPVKSELGSQQPRSRGQAVDRSDNPQQTDPLPDPSGFLKQGVSAAVCRGKRCNKVLTPGTTASRVGYCIACDPDPERKAARLAKKAQKDAKGRKR